MVATVTQLVEKRMSQGQPYLGPAEVVTSGRRQLDVALPTGEVVEATLALAYPYEPARGDTLLVIGGEEGLYIIGVIEGKGRLRMDFFGDVQLHARDGALTLSGDHGVKLRGPLLEVITDSFSVMASQAVQKFTTFHQRVREILTVQAGESYSIVEKTALHRAKKYAVVAQETASVNGKQILLG